MKILETFELTLNQRLRVNFMFVLFWRVTVAEDIYQGVKKQTHTSPWYCECKADTAEDSEAILSKCSPTALFETCDMDTSKLLLFPSFAITQHNILCYTSSQNNECSNCWTCNHISLCSITYFVQARWPRD